MAGVSKEDVEAALTAAMEPTHLQVIDTSGGCGASFEIEIVTAKFEGKRLLERHRMVNGALAEQLQHIHALSIKKALAPSQWNAPAPQPHPTPTEAPPYWSAYSSEDRCRRRRRYSDRRSTTIIM